MKAIIGQLKVKSKVNCTVCLSPLTRNLTVNIFENTPEAIEKAKEKLSVNAKKPYTCKICKSIIKSI